MIRNRPRDAAVFGVDLGKNVFHVVGVDAEGHPIQQGKFRRETLLQFFAAAKPSIVGMEACPGAAMVRSKAAGNRTFCADRASALYQAVREVP